ncbi:hypothetical protein HK104_007809 [Borealophlyctis nickersoniae]|nr:hypothetical protein HK104_007809 [Borealophlyctis nickersoniae]
MATPSPTPVEDFIDRAAFIDRNAKASIVVAVIFEIFVIVSTVWFSLRAKRDAALEKAPIHVPEQSGETGSSDGGADELVAWRNGQSDAASSDEEFVKGE